MPTMLNMSKFVSFAIIFFCLSTPLFGMLEDFKKVQAMSDAGQVEEFLNNSSFATEIAVIALNQLRNNKSVSHEIVDVYIKYADKDELAHAFSVCPEQESTYVTQQMRKKAETGSQPNPTINSQQPPKHNSTSGKSSNRKNILARAKKHLQRREKKIQDSETVVRSCTLDNEIAQETVETVDKLPEKDQQDSWQNLSGVESKNKSEQKNRRSVLSYAKWAGVCAGLSYLAYYFYSRKYKQVSQ